MLEVPAALPVLVRRAEGGVTLAVIGAVVGEFVGADRGLGFPDQPGPRHPGHADAVRGPVHPGRHRPGALRGGGTARALSCCAGERDVARLDRRGRTMNAWVRRHGSSWSMVHRSMRHGSHMRYMFVVSLLAVVLRPGACPAHRRLPGSLVTRRGRLRRRRRWRRPSRSPRSRWRWATSPACSSRRSTWRRNGATSEDAGLDVTFRYGIETDLLKLVGTERASVHDRQRRGGDPGRAARACPCAMSCAGIGVPGGALRQGEQGHQVARRS